VAAGLAGLLALPAPAVAGPLTANGTQPGLTYPLLKASACQSCHGDFSPVAASEPWPGWAGTMMAQAARDPLFWAALDVANHDAPGVGEFCLRCHVPDGWLAGRSEAPGGSPDGCGLVGNLDERDHDFEGVGCHLCHRMMVNSSPPPGQLPNFLENGQWWLDDTNCGGIGEPCRRGPYDYPGGVPPPPPHAFAHSPYHRSSEQCGTCHNVTSPTHNLIIGGVDAGIPFPIERTYQEWLFSNFSPAGPTPLSCQDCHMPQATENPAFACVAQQTNRAGDLATHLIAGGNAWIPDVIGQAYPSLGLGPELFAARSAALDQLQNRSALVEVTAPAVARAGADVAVQVKVTNLTGHKLPTGYPEGRRMWLHVVARDATGAVVWESGAYDAATGVLAADPEPKVYEIEPGIWNLNGTGECDVADGGGDAIFHFVRNDCIRKDNRIPPEGFSGAGNLEIQPVGYTYPETSPGSGRLVNFDVTTYAVAVPETAVSPVVITATLRYQTASKEYVDFLVDQAETHGFADDCLPRTTGLPGKSRARVLQDLWAATNRSPPVDMEVAAGSSTVRLVDPFLCYRTRRTSGTEAPLLPGSVAYANGFESSSLTPRQARWLCAPAALDGLAALDTTAHLEGHGGRTAEGAPLHAPQAGLTVRDQFGTLRLDTKKLVRLLAPAGVSATSLPPVAGGIDAYACYTVKPSAGAARFPSGVQVTADDGLASGGRLLDVRRPRRLCVSTQTTAPRLEPAAALLCYGVRPAAGAPRHAPVAGLYVASPLGASRLDVRTEDTLCVPALVTP
jgi:hypothetical protein